MVQVPATAISRIQNDIEHQWQQQNEFYRKTIESVMKIGQLLLKADAYFSKSADKIGLLDFESKLPFSKSTASKYRQIASNDALTDKNLHKRLPSSVHSLYELSQLDPKRLRSDLEKGVISPDSDRTTVSQYAAERKAIAPSGGGAGRPRKQNKSVYEDFLTIKIDKSTTAEDRQQLLEAFRKLAIKRPDVQCMFSKSVIADHLRKLKEEAEEEFTRLQEEMAPDNKFLVNLIDRTIEVARKNNGIVPAKYEWRGRLRKELGIDVARELRLSQIYKVARERGIISRFVPLKDHSEVIKTHIYVMNYCDGKKSALRLIQRIADGTLSGAKKDKAEARRIAKAYLDAMPWVL